MSLPLYPLIQSYIQHRWHRRFRNREHLLHWQNQQLKKHLKFVHQQSPFYQQQVSASACTNLEAWPLMNKADMQIHFDQINTRGLNREALINFALTQEQSRDFQQRYRPDINVGLSSGTSGSRGLFVTSPKEEAIWAGAASARISPRPLWQAQKVSLLLRAGNPMYAEVNRGPIQFQYVDLLSTADEQWEALQKFQPSLILAPPSVLIHLLSSQERAATPLRPERICAVAEMMLPEDKLRLEAAFCCPIFSVYQATEGFLASTCPHGSLHLHEDLIHFEWEPFPGRPRCYRPILTDLKRSTQPHIRYQMNDILEWDPKPCACGNPMQVIRQIHGRCDEVLKFPGTTSQKTVAIFPDLLIRALVSAHPALSEFKIIQKPDQTLLLEIQPHDLPEIQIACRQAIQTLCQKLQAHCPDITFSDWTPPQPGDKLRRVLRQS